MQNNWRTLNKHGIEWFEGKVREKHLFVNHRELLKQARIIYTYIEKVKLLQQVISREVINFDEDERFPPFDRLPSSSTYCVHHCIQNPSEEYQCALNGLRRKLQM